MNLDDLIPMLQLSIGPAILISGVGLILLSMTNRFGRVIDRARILARELRAADEADRPRLLGELTILSTRAKLVRAGIALAVISALMAALLVISLFLGALFDLEIAAAIASLFLFCMITLIAALVLFIFDIDLSLQALWLEIPREARRNDP